MGALNDAVASVWRLWNGFSARQSFDLQPPADGPGHSTRIVYVPRTEAGVRVSEDVALTYGAVYACTRIIAETIASLSWHVYRERAGGGKERVPGSVQTTLRDQANPETTAFSFREHMLASALLWGNGYAEIERDGAGRVVNLWQIAPDRVFPDRVNRTGELVYIVNPGQTVLRADQVMHLHGLGFDGVSGYSVVRLAARTIGVGLAGDKFAGTFYGNGTWIGGTLQTDATLTDAQRQNLKASWQEMFRGPDKAFHPAVLEAGLKWQSLGMPMTDAQFIENRKFAVTEVARWFRVPPHKLADLDRATFSNIEQQSIEFVQDTILPWAVRLEQEANRKLFGSNRSNLFTKLNLNALLRGDAQSRFSAYATGRQWGWLSANDIREMEDMNPLGSQGDVYLTPMNMTNAKTFTDAERNQQPEPPPALTISEEEETVSALKSSHRDLIKAALVRVARREAKWAKAARRKASGAELSRLIMGFLTSEGHREYAIDHVLMPAMAFARIVFAGRMTEDVDRIVREIVDLCLGERMIEAQERLLGDEAEDDEDDAAGMLLDRIVALRLAITDKAAA